MRNLLILLAVAVVVAAGVVSFSDDVFATPGMKVTVTPPAGVNSTTGRTCFFGPPGQTAMGSFTATDVGGTHGGDGKADYIDSSFHGDVTRWWYDPLDGRYEDENDPNKWVKFNQDGSTYTSSGDHGWNGGPGEYH
jgi:hypothetical protein